ncbi:putative F-box protein At5g55150 isoform X1 [Asparagus officinalis]|uniref:putative F-box protein At5g55150 isoform X1 n=2 Tax=Asparagus officinalis TaxID=4686 RepID=UPI00098E2926|nr:putative F-box protein At5g55150 isoform X1 [Asparagus officinalis]
MLFFSGMAADWSNLPRDAWMHIAQKFVFRDLGVFASVCAQWRDVAREVRGSFRSRPPLLMLPLREGTHVRGLYDLSADSVCGINLPQLNDRWICGASNGWLVTLDANLNIELFNPFSKAKLQLPPHPIMVDYQHRIYRKYRSCYMQKVILTGSPGSNRACFAASIVSNRRRLAVCGVGDGEWTDVETEPNRYVDITCYKGKLFAIRECGPLVVLDVGRDYFKTDTIDAPPDGGPLTTGGLAGNGSVCQKYLVESAGDLLVVLRFSRYSANGYRTWKFHVYKLNESVQGWTKVESLGDRSIFVGVSHSISAKVCGLDGCKSNCIYFLEDLTLHRDEKGFQLDCGLFCLEDGCTKTLPEEARSFWSKPGFWCMQSL